MRSGDPDPQAGFTLLNELSESEIDWLLTEGETLFCEREMILVQESCRIEYLYLVLEGVFGVSVGGTQGKEIAKLGPGQIVGEMSFLEDRPASATVTALEGSRVICIPRAKLEAKLRLDTAFSAHLHRALGIVTSRRLREAVGQLGRWLESAPSAEPDVLARWERIARITQQFKEQIIDVGKTLDGNDSPDTSEVSVALQIFSQRIDEAIGDGSPENIDAREELGARIQRELLPYFAKARTPHQLFEKPRGYPGDFRAIEMIIEAKPGGTSPVGEMLDSAFLQLPTCTALREAPQLISAEFQENFGAKSTNALRVAAIGAAPAMELSAMISRPNGDFATSATAIEFDSEALLRMRAHPPCSEPIRLELETLVDLALGRHRVLAEPYDFAYALTLGGALSDRFFVGMLNYLHEMLKPGGWAAVGSFHTSNPDRAFLKHIIDWPLYHRTESDVDSLFRHSRFGSACNRFRFERQGVFFVALCEKG